MDAHRSRSLGMATLVFILISLTAAVFHGVAPVRAEDVSTPTPIVIDGKTATVDVRLYADENHTQELKDPVTSTSTLYGAFLAQFKSGKAPSPENYIAVYELPDTIVVDENAGGNLMEGPEASAAQAGTWKIAGNKVVFTFDKAWLAKKPCEYPCRGKLLVPAFKQRHRRRRQCVCRVSWQGIDKYSHQGR